MLNSETFQTMHTLKNTLILPPMLTLSLFGGHMILGIGVYNVQIICALLQKQLYDTRKPYGY